MRSNRTVANPATRNHPARQLPLVAPATPDQPGACRQEPAFSLSSSAGHAGLRGSRFARSHAHADHGSEIFFVSSTGQPIWFPAGSTTGGIDTVMGIPELTAGRARPARRLLQ